MLTADSPQARAMHRRNIAWRNNPAIPSWVDIESAPLDQFFTRPDIAQHCHASLISFIQRDGGDIEAMRFVEPSAGTGAFLSLLPPERRIGLDIMAQSSEITETDFLEWEPQPGDSSIAVIGNPPFGYRAWLALQFVNHAASFAEYVGFILPMAFQSDGKGSPKRRVRGLHLVHTELLPQGSFVDASGKVIKVNALWQIWKRGEKTTDLEPSCEDWVDLFTVDQRRERMCGQEQMADADFFLQRTFYRDAPTLVTDFAEVKYACGYGIVIKKDPERVEAALRSTDWNHYSNLAAHNCRHISMYHIRRALTDLGLTDSH